MADKPVKRKRIIVRYEWRCNDPSHHHSTEAIAQRCIGAKKEQAAPKWTPEAYGAVLRLREAEERTFKEIGALYGVSSCRAAQVYAKACGRRERAQHAQKRQRELVQLIEYARSIMESPRC